MLLGRRAVGRALDAGGIAHPWVKARPNPASPEALGEFKLFAIVATWMEADVIEATVKNAYTQGCDRVFVVDNNSPDDTVARAIGAGAELADSFATNRFDIDLAYEVMNECVTRISAADGSEHIWWLWLDADEFPHGPQGLTLRDYLATLDRSFRIVGARYINHYPSGDPHYVPGLHPLDFQPLAEELTTRTCWSWHRKHPLQRFDRNRPLIKCDIGIHRGFSTERPLLEPAEPILVHHFPFRAKDTTLRRLNALFNTDEALIPRADSVARGTEHMKARHRSLDAVYSQNWNEVPMEVVPGCRRPRKEPVIWTELVLPQNTTIKRWYRLQGSGRSRRLGPVEAR